MTSTSMNRRIVAYIWRWVSLNVKSILRHRLRLADGRGLLWTMVTAIALGLGPVPGTEVHLSSAKDADEITSEGPHRRVSTGGIAA
jgi:hypothetical protein